MTIMENRGFERFNLEQEAANDNAKKSEVLDDPHFQRISKVADHLEEITDDDTFQREAHKFADTLAHLLENKESYVHKAYKGVRKAWDKLPHSAQWAILKGEEHIPIAPPVMNSLIETGMLKYKGHASAEDRDEQLHEKQAWNQKKEKWGVRIAAIFAPEIIEFMPVIELVQRFKASKSKVFEIIRHRLDTLKIEEETEGKEKKVMTRAADEGEVPYADAA